MTTEEILEYYIGLLIIQYSGEQPKAQDTIEALAYCGVMDQLPTQVQDAYTLGTAMGAQLDIIGQYAGVIRTGYSTTGQPISLNDSDFTSLIRMAIIQNSGGSSLADIQNLLHEFFPNEVFVYDHANMQLSYLIASSVGSQDLVQLFVTEHLLPKPMGVALSSTIYIPTTTLYGWNSYTNFPQPWNAGTVYSLDSTVQDTNSVTYLSLIAGNVGNPTTDATSWRPIVYPMNSYSNYNQTYTWLSYADTISV